MKRFLFVALVMLWTTGAQARQFISGPGIAGFYTPDDGTNHVISGTTDGNVWETYYHNVSFGNVGLLTSHSGLNAVAGFYTPDDHYRHAISATSSGTIWECYYQPAYGIFEAPLTTLPPSIYGNIVGLTGHYDPTNHYRYVFVQFDTGYIYAIRWGGGTGITTYYFAYATWYGSTAYPGIASSYDSYAAKNKLWVNTVGGIYAWSGTGSPSISYVALPPGLGPENYSTATWGGPYFDYFFAGVYGGNNVIYWGAPRGVIFNSGALPVTQVTTFIDGTGSEHVPFGQAQGSSSSLLEIWDYGSGWTGAISLATP